MKFVTYESTYGSPRAGIAVGGKVVDLADGAAGVGRKLPSDLLSFLDLGDEGLEIARQVERAAERGEINARTENEVRLLAAVSSPPSVFLLAGNYQSHLTEEGAPPVEKARITPRPFIKPRTAVIGSGDPIVIPLDSDKVDYEIEIAAVIGKGGKHIPLAEADNHVFGYTIFNDISARELNIAANRSPRKGDDFFDWLLGKWCDSFAAVGPYLVTRDEAGDPSTLEMALTVNGELRQHSSAGEMIFSINETVAFLSRFVTLEAGDLICMGTPGGVGATTATYLQPGDVVEAKIERLGTLVNTVAGSR